MTKEEFHTKMAALQAEYDAAIQRRNQCDMDRRAAEKKMGELKDEFIQKMMAEGGAGGSPASQPAKKK